MLLLCYSNNYSSKLLLFHYLFKSFSLLFIIKFFFSLSHFSFENFPFKVKLKILIKILLNYWSIFHNVLKNDYKIYIYKNNNETSPRQTRYHHHPRQASMMAHLTRFLLFKPPVRQYTNLMA